MSFVCFLCHFTFLHALSFWGFFFLACGTTVLWKYSVCCYTRGMEVLTIKLSLLHGIEEYYLHLSLIWQIKILKSIGKICFFLGSISSHWEKKASHLLTSHNLEVQKMWLFLTTLLLVNLLSHFMSQEESASAGSYTLSFFFCTSWASLSLFYFRIIFFFIMGNSKYFSYAVWLCIYYLSYRVMKKIGTSIS